MERRSVSGRLVIVRTFVIAIVFGAAANAVLAARTENHGTSSLYRKVCRGSMSGISHDHGRSPRDRYMMYRAQYANCTYVNGNLVIAFLSGEDDYDMSFLEDIQEVSGYVSLLGNHFSYISLTNLRIIRGRSLFTMPEDSKLHSQQISYSLFIASNYKSKSETVGLKELRLTSLHEIMDGNVYFYNNNLLCFDNTIDWKDILTGEGTEVMYKNTNLQEYQRPCNHCHSNCTYDKDRHCWGEGPEMCQSLTKVTCSKQCDGRCFGVQPNECCHPECAGGCYGPYKNNCFACKNFADDGECVGLCPPEFKYQDFKWVPNPKAKFTYGTLCVKECPDHLIMDMGACISDCGLHRMAHKGKCVQCDGPCPKTCPGTGTDFLHSHNINNFTDCTVIHGGIRILHNSFDGDRARNISGLKVEQLSVLETIQEITGYLMIHANARDFVDLSFFKNLRVIHGRSLDITGSSFQIMGTSLESLGLNSLKSILKGQVLITGNERLCYADQLNWWYLFTARSVSKRNTVRVQQNRDPRECAARGKVCSVQCTADGCWGPGPSECLSCAEYHQDRLCVAFCELGWYAVELNHTKECRRCHKECQNSCSGEDADQCDSCLHVKDGPYCVSECPSFKYLGENGSCLMCHANCQGGCTGPTNTVGPGGCNACAAVVYEGQSSQAPSTWKPIVCLPPDSDCQQGFYKQYVLAANASLRHQACFRCHPECKTCTGSDLSFCNSCVNYVEGSRCVSNCSSNYYADNTTGRCIECDSHCFRCTGPTSADCLSCRDLKLYENLDRRHISPVFNCTARCPGWSPVRISETRNGERDSVCVPEAYAQAYHGHPERKQIGMIVSISLGSLILIGIIIVVIVYLRRQWARSEENKIRLTARMSGLEECEPLSPSNAKPDMAMLRLIKESELQRGNIIGSGAFGTVYKGAWIPAGENVKIPVAIKVLQEGTSPSQNKELLEEARIMASVEHQCCVRILAVCMTAQMMLVTQLMPLGCLLDYVRKNKVNVGSKVLLNWSTQIARGMKYLEDRAIVHRDLAARNVLVQSPAQVKITDFGLSKLLDFNEEHFQAAGGKMPIKWLALECIQHRIFTHKSDVWSFGVTMWELYTYGQRPYESVPAKDIPDLLEKGERLPQPMICTIDVYMIMIKCWMLDAESRPSFYELAEEFAKMARDPGRFLVVPGDKLMRLPTQTYDTRDLLAGAGSDGPEEVMSAEEYLQPQGLMNSMHLCSMPNGHVDTETDHSGGVPRYHSNSHHSNSHHSNSHHGNNHHSNSHHSNSHHSNSAGHERSGRGSSGFDSYSLSSRREPRYSGLETSSARMQRVFNPTKDHTNSRYSSDPCKTLGTSTSDSRSSEPVSTLSQDSGLVSSQDESGGKSLLMDLDDRGVGMSIGEDDYLQPKMSSTSTYLDLVDSSDTEERAPDLSKIQTNYLLITKEAPGSAICNPEYFDDVASALDSNPPNGTIAVPVLEKRLDQQHTVAFLPTKSSIPEYYNSKRTCSSDKKPTVDMFMKPFTESEV